MSASRPGFGTILSPDHEGGEPLAQVWPNNPIEGGAAIPPLVGDLVCSSGWCGEAVAGPAGPVVRPDLRTWSATGWAAFERVALELDAAATAAGVDVILRPHARHVLADPQSTLAWLKRTNPNRLKILLDPAGWLTPSMMETADDHLARAFESFTGHPAVWGTMLTGLVAADVEDDEDGLGLSGGELVACPLGHPASVLPVQTLLGAVGGYPLAGHPVVLLAEGLGDQRGLLPSASGSEPV